MKNFFEKTLKESLTSGASFPQASREAYRKLNLTSETFDLSQPNNILGFSYVKAIKELNANIEPTTVTRTKVSITMRRSSIPSQVQQVFEKNFSTNIQ